MKKLYFDNVKSLCRDIVDKYGKLTDIYGDITIIAKYKEAREIIKELLCMGYDIAGIDIYPEEFNEYCDEYIISLTFDGIWCEKFKRDNGYITDDSTITYVSNECNSDCIPYVKNAIYYSFKICKNEHDEDSMEDVSDRSDSKDTYHVMVRCDLDADEALDIVTEMKKYDIFEEMDRFRRLFNW